ncbi:hypothetical protein HF668_16370 [Acidithiobacillus ferridurans]|uniref:hypothetical protein n=1 Tax=Acidithiobacillus ferridurans TaxID=1232575 RepID=UPI001C0779AE|nr:hypothetical protein [Acidithiobacillus ferridurans]MBU2806681.1 hypothetical protein [Acidithiobacillus ferridurans]
MKEPVSLDLFPSDVCPSSDDFAVVVRSRSLLREKFLFYITPLASRNAYARHVLSMRSMSARGVLDELGGLGGVW